MKVFWAWQYHIEGKIDESDFDLGEVKKGK
jgi:hypothetical protein